MEALEWFKGIFDRAWLSLTGGHTVCYIYIFLTINWGNCSAGLVLEATLVIYGGSNETISNHYHLVQYVYDFDLPVLLLLLACAHHHHAC